MKQTLTAALLLLGLAVASWGLTVAVPALARTVAGYVTRDLYLVLAWSAIWIACAVGLFRVARRR
jgi:hypothetical protein